MKIVLRQAPARGMGHPWWILAWVRFGEDGVHEVFERPLSRLFLRHARLAHEAGHILTLQGNKRFHHPAHHLCGRVGHGLRIFGRRHLPEDAWEAAYWLQAERHWYTKNLTSKPLEVSS